MSATAPSLPNPIAFRRAIFSTTLRCASCDKAKPYDGHRSSLPLGWAYWLAEKKLTCDSCNGARVDERAQTAIVKGHW